jgi:hypothetical protein
LDRRHQVENICPLNNQVNLHQFFRTVKMELNVADLRTVTANMDWPIFYVNKNGTVSFSAFTARSVFVADCIMNHVVHETWMCFFVA